MEGGPGWTICEPPVVTSSARESSVCIGTRTSFANHLAAAVPAFSQAVRRAVSWAVGALEDPERPGILDEADASKEPAFPSSNEA